VAEALSSPSPEELVAALSLDERVRMLHQHSPAVERLGLPAWHTGAEVLHGIAWNGVATVFPQAVGLASAWDLDLLERVGRAVSQELHAMRADHPRLGLNVWAPVVNPLRNPLWGRTEEGYSEDPSLTAQCATAFTSGLRAGDSGAGAHGAARWATAPTLKHFVGYNNETDRDVTSSSLSERVLREYELPAFLGPIEAGSVAAVMASYNLVNGIPAHASPVLALLRSLLADPDDLAIVSDAGAPSNLWRSERFVPDPAHAVAVSLAAGVDSFTDDDSDPEPITAALHAALAAGLITEQQVGRAVLRLFRLRAKTGELAAAEAWAGASAAELREAHRPLALEAATASIVLLSNPAGALPLAAAEPIAVIGALGSRVLTDWYSGSLPYSVSIADGLAAVAEVSATARGNDLVRLGAGGAFLSSSASGALSLAPDAGSSSSFELERWGEGLVTLRSVDSDRLVTVADGVVSATAEAVGGWFVQEAFVLDGAALQHRVTGKWLGVTADGVVLVDEPFAWELSVESSGLEASAAAAAGRTAVVVVGNDPHLHGRETEDRPRIALPEPDAALVGAVAAAAERTVLVIVSPYPYALGPVEGLADAVVWTSHGGQELGSAVAAVLTGAASPRGRLTQSWPAADDDVPELLDYDIIGSRQTYLYSQARPAFPFGHGLHYSVTGLADASSSVSEVAAGPVADRSASAGTIRVSVVNSGPRGADEVVQIYVGADGDDEPRRPFPHRRLAAWARVPVAAGATESVALDIPLGAFAQWDPRSQRWVIEPGAYRVHVGTSAEDLPVSFPVVAAGPGIEPVAANSWFSAALYDDAARADLVTDPVSLETSVRVRTAVRAGAGVASDAGARAALRFAGATVGESRRLELAASAGEGPVAFRALTAQGATAAEGTALIGAGGEASASLPGIAAGDVIDLELEFGEGLALRAFRLS